MLDQTVKFEDVDQFELEMEHYDDLKTELEYDTSWSMGEGIMQLDHKIFTDKQRVVTYKCIESMGDTMDDVKWAEFSTFAVDGTVGGLWRAAESLFQQAKAQLDDWHYFVENFEMQDDGSLELVTGS